jgi:hypothetical protein
MKLKIWIILCELRNIYHIQKHIFVIWWKSYDASRFSKRWNFTWKISILLKMLVCNSIVNWRFEMWVDIFLTIVNMWLFLKRK